MDMKRAQGWTWEGVTFAIDERLSVNAYARALGLDDAALCRLATARTDGHPGRPVPPVMYAFFHVVPGDVLTGELGFTWGRTLAASVEFEADRTASETERVTGRSRVESAWERPGRDGAARQFLRLTTDFLADDGALVCRNSVLFIERKDGPADDAFLSEGEPPREPWVPRRHAQLLPALPVELGSPLPEVTAPAVDRLMLARMSVAIDNPDPVHLDEEGARAAGLPGVIGHGTTVVGLLYEVVRRWAGMDRVLAGRTTQARPFGVGTVLCAGGQVAGIRGHAGRLVASCSTWLRDGDGNGIGEGTFDVAVS
jgi:acyl dehydratase